MAKEKLIKISNKDWHYRLVKYCCGIEPNMFKNLCPYFWITVASIFVVIPLFVYNTIKNIVIKIGKGIVNFIDKTTDKLTHSLDDYIYQSRLGDLTNSQIYYLCNLNNREIKSQGDDIPFFNGIKKKLGKSYDTIIRDILKSRNINEEYVSKKFKNDYKTDIANNKKIANEQQRLLQEKVEAKKKREIEVRKKQFEEEQKKREREKKLRETMYKISNNTKTLCMGLFILFLFSVFYVLTYCFSWITIAFITLLIGINWTYVSTCALVSIGIFAMLGSIVYGSYKFAVFFEKIYVSRDDLKGYRKVIYYISYKVYRLLCKIETGFYYLYIYLLYYPFYVFLLNIVFKGILIGFVEGFNEFGGIFKDYFNASYSDYCPGIEWNTEQN